MMLLKTKQRMDEALSRHVRAFAGRDVDALMSDYCEDAVLLTPDGVLRGSNEIRAFFEAFLAGFPPGSTFEVSRRIVERTVAYLVWSGRSETLDLPFAAETLIVRDGKILAQTFAAHIKPGAGTQTTSTKGGLW